MKKDKNISQVMLDELPISSPAPDNGLTTVGQDLLWVPPNFKSVRNVKKELKVDIMDSIL